MSPVETWDGTETAQKALSNIFRTEQRFGANHLAQVLTGKESDRIKRFGHHRVSTFGIGADMTQEQWKSVYRQLLAAGLCSVDLDRFNALTLNERSWPVLKGEQPVRFRTDPVLPKKTGGKRKRTAAAAASDVLTNWEAEALFDRLREVRLELAGQQEVPPYAILPDRTLLEIVRYRPQSMEDMGCMSGMGRAKIDKFGETFLASLKDHEAEHGRPATVPDIPEDLRAAGEKKMQRKEQKEKTFSNTARTSLDLFRKHGTIERVAAERGLKPPSIWNHMTQAVQFGHIPWREVVDLPDDELNEIVDTLKAFQARSITSLTPAFESLDKRHPFELLRFVRACMRTG